jgi:pectinesterase
VLANGPVRTVFELRYDAWDAAGAKVSELKRFTVDAGHYFDRIDSAFDFTGPSQLTAAIGLNRHPSDKGEEQKVDFTENQADGALVQWVSQKSLGDFGVAVIVPPEQKPSFAGDARNALVLAPASPGRALRYYVGAAWTRGSEFKSQQDWQRYVSEEAARLRAPVSVALSAGR